MDFRARMAANKAAAMANTGDIQAATQQMVAPAPVAQVAPAPVAQVAPAPVAQVAPVVSAPIVQPGIGLPPPAAVTATEPKEPKVRAKSLASCIRAYVLQGMNNADAWAAGKAEMGMDPNDQKGAGIAGWQRNDLRKKGLLPPAEPRTPGQGGVRKASGMRSAAKIKAWKAFYDEVAREDAATAQGIMAFIQRREAEANPPIIPTQPMHGANFVQAAPAAQMTQPVM